MSAIPATLLTLRLSSPSFLETILTDNGRPVYSTETYGNTTSLSRCDPYTGLTLVANINWPDHASPKGKCKFETPQAQLFFDGSTMSEEDLLKRNRLNTSRKFRIPGHSQSLKWRRVQGVFQCTSSAGIPVAVFEPAIITARARLNIFVPTLSGLLEPQDGSISSLLVDYLIVTALLLLTHPEDWHGFAVAAAAAAAAAAVATPVSSPVSSPVAADKSTPMSTPPRAGLPQLAIPQTRTSRPPTASSSASTPSASTPISPITSLASSSSSSLSACWDERERIRGRVSVDSQFPELKEEVAEYEPPPPYEEIQWTVRVRQPRRARA